MSLAGIWGRSPLSKEAALSMLSAFVPAVWDRRAVSDGIGNVVLAAAAAKHDAADIVVSSLTEPELLIGGDLRLHNAAELATALGVGASMPAPALIGRAYARWGCDFSRHLIGDYALALWDRRECTLLLARDSGGACPLFYTTDFGRLAFASTQRALLALPGLSDRLSEETLIEYLIELPGDERRTLFASVRRLPPGACVAFTMSGERVVGAFDPFDIPERAAESDAQHARSLRDALREAVACRLPPSGDVAVMLSGGLDSSSMAALASAELSSPKRRLHSISAVFPDMPECDERAFQAAVVARTHTIHHEVEPAPDASAGDFENLCRVFAEPAFIGPHWLAWAAAEVAAGVGARRMLTGIDGDRVVSHGAGRFGDLAAARDWLGLGRELWAVHDFGWARRLRVGAVQGVLSLLPPSAAAAVEARDPRRRFRWSAVQRLLHSRVAREHDVAARIAALPLRARSSRLEHARTLVASDRNWDVELLAQLGTAFNVRFEQPFFDRRVVELCFSLPGNQKRQRGWPRYVLRNAMREVLPAVVVDRRTDASFDRPYWRWARRWLLDGEPITSHSLENISEYIRVDRLMPSLRQLPLEPGRRPVDLFWRCVVLSRWLNARERIRPTSANVSPPASNLGSRGGTLEGSAEPR